MPLGAMVPPAFAAVRSLQQRWQREASHSRESRLQHAAAARYDQAFPRSRIEIAEGMLEPWSWPT